jgi:hypothetical protein
MSMTIAWTITDEPRGVVITQSVNGGADKPFFPMTGRTNANGQQPATIEINKTYLFKLKDSRDNVLASVTVTARQAQPPVFTGAAFDMRIGVNLAANLGYIQIIRNLRVVPGFYYADFEFTLSQPTTPFITVAIAPPGPGPAFNPADVVVPTTPILHTTNNQHQYHSRVSPLTPSTLYYYIIMAGGSTPNDPLATKTGSFTTSLRDAIVYFDEVDVIRDGDTNSKGELSFSFAVYDGVSRLYLRPDPGPNINYMYYPVIGHAGIRADIGDGDHVKLNLPAIVIENAPPTLTLFVECTDDEELWTGMGSKGFSPPKIAPGKGFGDYDYGQYADAQEDFDISFEVHGGPFIMSFRMKSPPAGVWFEVIGRIEISNVTFAMSRSASLQFLP